MAGQPAGADHGCAAWTEVDTGVREAYLHLDALDRRGLAALDVPLTPAQYHALAALDREPRQSLGALAARLLCDKANASGLVSRLLDLGLAARTTNPADRRRVMLTLTPAGRLALARAIDARGQMLASALAPLDPGEVEALRGHLVRLGALLEAELAARGNAGQEGP